MLKLRYYLSMLSVLAIDAVLTATFAILSGNVDLLPQAAIASLLVLGGLNLVGSHLMFRPIAAYLDGRGALRDAVRRLRRLPARAAAWIGTVAVIYGLVAFSLGIFVPEDIDETTPALVLAGMMVWFLFVYATYMCFAVYFAVTDLAAQLRAEIFRRDGLVLAVGRGRLLHRLIVVFAVVAVMPVALVLLDLSLFQEVRQQQGLGPKNVVFLDLLGALFAAALSLVFVTRSLVRPIDRLMQAVQRVRGGKFDALVPVTSNDELGVLAASFNGMVSGLREREFIRDTFGKYVSADVAKAILSAEGQRPEDWDRGGRTGGRLTGRVVEATVMFTDIEDFSELAGTMAPAAVMDMLNAYFTVLAEPIQAFKGTINNFIGDAVLTTFNLPVADADHAANAVRCALEIQRRLAGERLPGGVVLKTRIGINTGPVVAGSLGPPDRLAYTVLGDQVNLAARVEVLNKRFGSHVLVTASTRERCGGAFAFRAMGTATVKGHPDPVQVFEPSLVA
ncbi:MAG: adenylate/guanylate cyclase domain-containing protein [Inquilinus sp.]|nr:adenylate/guanylate cyclase domain-containing protein [Inquilinus sp.]